MKLGRLLHIKELLHRSSGHAEGGLWVAAVAENSRLLGIVDLNIFP